MESQGSHLSPLELIPVTAENWPIYRARVRVLEDVFGPVSATDDQLDSAMLDPENIRVVVVESAQPNDAVAYAYAEPLKAALHLDGPKQDWANCYQTLYLNTCSVAPSHMGRGLAKWLREYRMLRGYVRGFTRFTMHVRTSLLAKPASIYPHRITSLMDLPKWRGMPDSWSYVDLDMDP